ncbi:MAG: peptide deformylase [Deltaproteobacteria bacterium]|nr:peptide deformylase [Deltaproteobacteria bacterium]
MAVLPITIYPAPILKRKAKQVPAVTDEIRRLLDDMAETMYAAPGIGLAAPQVNVGLRVIVVDVGEPVPLLDRTEPKETRRKLYQLVNPEIVAREGEVENEEGCLSIPHFRQVMKRRAKVTVRALDRTGKPIEIAGHELLSVALQHEIDHLEGKLIIDGLSQLKKEQYLRQLKQWEKEQAAHVPGEL